MEGAESGSRSSGILSIMNREHIERINTDPRYIQSHPMAAPTTASPASAQYSNGGPYSAGWPGSSHTGLISPPESRRTSNDKAPPLPLQTNTSHRQSLPSIQEALSSTSTKPGPTPTPNRRYFRRHAHMSRGGHFNQLNRGNLPLPCLFSHHLTRAQISTQGTLLNPGGPQYYILQSHSLHQPIPTQRLDMRPLDMNRNHGVAERFVERPMNEYAQPSPLHNQHPYANAAAQPVHPPHPPPHGQAYPQPPYPPRDDRDLGVAGYKNYKTQNEPFNQGVKRQLEVWDVDNNIAQINVSSTNIQEWSRHFYTISQEQPRSHIAIPERSPEVRDIEDMLVKGHRIVNCLERMLTTALQQKHADEQSRGARLAPDYDDESVFADDRHHQNFGGPDNKKRRGRAAPPGRCHSCNRAETPEWRRGPDGARTLCNACGLHYAKLTRKNTMKQSQGSTGSSLRPKSSEDHSPRS
ncbi:hypothetical protein EYC84_010969 [Monilinia fructicola]|uniref:GATA-type domain-containing protein n=1 Tax=Monilinia fructicola TaxID=38448 RepID=A0A5M9JBI5_MONFR|nr:hypothetical protein EYC84_010969 [Monilinia fructicola]